MFEQAERRKKELEATKLEASKTLKKDKRITRKHRSYGFCLKPTDRDQVDPEVQVRNCSFVACTSVEMFLVGLCLPLDPSSAHFDSVGGRRSNFRRIFSVSTMFPMTLSSSTVHSVTQTSDDSGSLIRLNTHQKQIEREKADEEEQLGLDEEERKHPKGKGGDRDSFTLGRIVHSISASFDFVGCDSSLTSGHPFFGLSLLFYLLPVLGSRLGTRSFTQHRAFRVEYNICFFFRIRKWSKSLPVVKETTSSLSIEECSFGSPESDTPLTSALSTSHSATLRVELTDTDTLCFTTIRIESCSLTGAPLLSLVLSATQHTNWDLNLKGISFAEESSNSVLSGALIFISGTSFATQLALSLPATSSLTITSCSFTSFTSSTSPSILSSTIQPIQSVTLSDTSFVSCHSSVSARSGVLDVSLIEGITITFTHSCETFTSCSSPKRQPI
ncbi:hypothetical protein BLNAU_22565 [Blattamonas nauphoetae]|uniref:Uncharacterized protein n=1 Tax=Blattamonas nauphoetae TaxID=2049346 RepID=A0ABQ9WSN5_9EUKA|nr:hypothetical protein BLNAU_22565 [Blattamonas nauphoetae]